jgi:hypothetical protein
MPLEFTEPVRAERASALAANVELPDHQEVCEGVKLVDTAALAREVSVSANRRRRVLIRGGFGAVLFALAGAITMVALRYLLPENPTWVYSFLGVYVLLLVGIIGGATSIRKGLSARELRRKVETLAAENTVAASGALIDALAVDDRKTGRIARQALIRLARRWTEEDVAALSASQRGRLRGIVIGMRSAHSGDGSLGPAYRQERAVLRIAICQALARTGGAEDLRALRQESNFPAVTAFGIKIRAAAREAIPLLEARVAEKNRPQTLLRAATPPSARPEELLRAAASTSNTTADQLLRAENGSSTPQV